MCIDAVWRQGFFALRAAANRIISLHVAIHLSLPCVCDAVMLLAGCIHFDWAGARDVTPRPVLAWRLRTSQVMGLKRSCCSNDRVVVGVGWSVGMGEVVVKGVNARSSAPSSPARLLVDDMYGPSKRDRNGECILDVYKGQWSLCRKYNVAETWSAVSTIFSCGMGVTAAVYGAPSHQRAHSRQQQLVYVVREYSGTMVCTVNHCALPHVLESEGNRTQDRPVLLFTLQTVFVLMETAHHP
ncbi:hypothetical protein C7974DRAFT_192952 [Boeremia exigua]|uniref:uncharacterized protein n=1 Tax=Boeremia exigua TaxID=749465 RepID=UPI001E8EB91E|nr:uncharacterized protein C7974DRAFT_192952 [Boeremia exigua]KAH6629780.1 hypothetical protein C7974DRAFT_192952 [Boeremia exigua]